MWQDEPARDQVSQFEAKAHRKCVLCVGSGRSMPNSVCICLEWGRYINGQTQLKQANRGLGSMTGLLFDNMSNARGQPDTSITSTNELKREAKFIPNRWEDEDNLCA